ncbi:carbon dioxide concentrating mechanism protein [Cyanobacterium stanieri PCC 7202]|uniref:Carbon dioxide concentrating mechanism protein n=1 Tax=Cyanobacterium stanieri (strain ATCC 29140 / PCC 7202) TaxID=292563 RepID=K9YIJ9_CYASC|nr:carbon dioxide concentrating mechanism protein [Cyanobacterium stanieri PCC 7202]
MSLPILQPSTSKNIQIRGDVTIDDSAVIADGVIINAPEGAKIIIRSGVCLGMGSIITAFPEATIEIKANAILGAGCLIFGQCTIGNQVSIGSAVTIYNVDIEPLSVIPSGTVMGDRSRTVTIESETIPEASSEETQEITTTQKETAESEKAKSDAIKQQEHLNKYRNKIPSLDSVQNQIPTTPQNHQDTTPQEDTQNKQEKQEAIATDDDPWGITKSDSKEVAGQVYINRLFVTLFPEKNIPPQQT